MESRHQHLRRVVIVDDSRTMRALLEEAFRARPGYRVVDVAGDVGTALDVLRRIRADIVTVDLRLPGSDGTALLAALQPMTDLCKVVISDHAAGDLIVAARLEALGAAVCLGKQQLARNPDAFFARLEAAIAVFTAAKRPGKVADVAGVPRAEAFAISFPVPLDETRRLAALHRKGLCNGEAERPFDLLTGYLAAAMRFPVSLLTFIDRDTQWIKSACGFGARSTPREQAFCNYTICGDDAFVVGNAAKDERFARHPLVVGPPHIRTYVGHPVIAQDGTRLGALCLIDSRPRSVTRPLVDSLATFAALVGEMLDRRPAL